MITMTKHNVLGISKLLTGFQVHYWNTSPQAFCFEDAIIKFKTNPSLGSNLTLVFELWILHLQGAPTSGLLYLACQKSEQIAKGMRTRIIKELTTSKRNIDRTCTRCGDIRKSSDITSTAFLLCTTSPEARRFKTSWRHRLSVLLVNQQLAIT